MNLMDPSVCLNTFFKICLFNTGSPYAAQAGLELSVLQPQPSEYCMTGVVTILGCTNNLRLLNSSICLPSPSGAMFLRRQH
jgi:hypothetical protein